MKVKIVLKINKAYNLPYKKKAETYSKDATFLTAWNKLKMAFPWLSLYPLMTRVSAADINKLVDTAIRLDPTYKPGNFFSYFYTVADLKDNKEVKKTITLIKSSGLFEYAEAEEPVTLPVASVPGHFLPATIGVNLNAAWNVIDPITLSSAGKGDGVEFIDIERGWNFEHSRLNTRGRSMRPLSGTISADANDIEHGTATLGIILADHPADNCIGIAPNCIINTVSILETTTSSPWDENISSALMYAINQLSYGAIILVEVEMGFFLIERYPYCYDVIRLGTALGMVVIEPAGNNSDDITPYISSDDSKAIVVGGADSVTRKRGDMRPEVNAPGITSNYGHRVDCFAWGNNIFTTSNITGTETRNDFDGTSGASAIIAGVAISIQGILQALVGRKYNSVQMRRLLCTGGTSSFDTTNTIDLVGVMPDLDYIIRNLSGADTTITQINDVYIRDNIDDIGDRHTGAISCSPDIVTVNGPSEPASPADCFDNPAITSTVLRATGINNYVYVRVFNRGVNDAFDVTVKVYYAEVASLVIPEAWNLIGTTMIPRVARGIMPTISDAIPWNTSGITIPPDGHYCYVCVIGNAQDPMPLVVRDTDMPINIGWDSYCSLIRDNNNITWKNFNVHTVEASSTAPVILSFILAGATDKDRVFDIHLTSILPEDAIIRFEFPAQLSGLFENKGYKIGTSQGAGFIEWSKTNLVEFNKIKLPKKLRASCKLIIRLPKKIKKKDNFYISLTQVCKKLIVGKITWVIQKKL